MARPTYWDTANTGGLIWSLGEGSETVDSMRALISHTCRDNNPV